jgi:hypothetical protein
MHLTLRFIKNANDVFDVIKMKMNFGCEQEKQNCSRDIFRKHASEQCDGSLASLERNV